MCVCVMIFCHYCYFDISILQDNAHVIIYKSKLNQTCSKVE